MGFWDWFWNLFSLEESRHKSEIKNSLLKRILAELEKNKELDEKTRDEILVKIDETQKILDEINVALESEDITRGKRGIEPHLELQKVTCLSDLKTELNKIKNEDFKKKIKEILREF